MAILRDYHCPTHGYFESFEAQCPMKACEEEVAIVHLQPVGLKSDKTKRTDKTVKQLAIDYDMTDIKTTREGEHQTGYLKRHNQLSDKQFAEADAVLKEQQKQQGPRPGDQAIWGGGGNISMKSVMAGQFKPVKDEVVGINPKSAGNLTGPKASVIMQDHENLQVSKP